MESVGAPGVFWLFVGASLGAVAAGAWAVGVVVATSESPSDPQAPSNNNADALAAMDMRHFIPIKPGCLMNMVEPQGRALRLHLCLDALVVLLEPRWCGFRVV